MSINLAEIKVLIEEDQLEKANNQLQIYFRENGIDSEGQKMFIFLKKKIEKHNNEIAEYSMNEISNLIKLKQYDQAYKKLESIKKYNQNNLKFKNFYLKITEKINREQNSQYKKFIKLQKKKLLKLIKNNQEEEALKEIQELCIKHPNNPQLKILFNEIKEEVVKHKYQKNKKLIDKGDSKTKFNFYKKLFEIDPNNKDIKKELINAKRSIDENHHYEKENFIKDSLLQIKVLYNTNKFEKCMKACTEFLRFNKNSKEVQKFYAKSHKRQQAKNLANAYNIKKKNLTKQT